MKIILSAFAFMFLILTIITNIRRRFRPETLPDNKWIITGIIICVVMLILISAYYYQSRDIKDLSRLLIPGAILAMLIDQYRRNQNYIHNKANKK